MRSNRLGALLCLLVGLAGCESSAESVPPTPPPAEAPGVPETASLRPYYQMGRGAPIAAGTAFVVEDKSGKRYMLTAAHVLDDAEWRQVRSVSLRVMEGGSVASVQGRPLHIGKPFDSADASVDLVIWLLADGSKVAPLKLATADAKRNQWVWAIGQEQFSGPQKLYRSKVTGTEDGGLLLQQQDKFEMRGFSGGPLVNAQGEVIGSVLGGDATSVLASRVSSIRARLAEAKVELP